MLLPVKLTLTAKLKLLHPPEQKAALDAAALAYRDGLNYASQVAFDHGKLSNQNRVQKLTYPTLRARGIPSQMACNIARAVGATYKELWTKFEQHQKRQQARMAAGQKPRPFRGFSRPPRFVSRTLTYSYGRDYSLKKDQGVSLGTLQGRVVMGYEGYGKHLDWLRQGATLGAARLYYQKSKRQYYLLVSFEVEVPDPHPAPTVVGVDMGQRYHLVATDTHNRTLFISGKEARQRKDHYARKRRELQAKGTRSARRRLIALGGRERRFMASHDHAVSRRLLARYPQALIGLEDLTHIRERTEHRGRTPKGQKAARHRSQWSFARLQQAIAYKAPLYGSMATRVDAHYTSQCCPRCGHCSRANRPVEQHVPPGYARTKGAGLLFVCEACGLQGHADLIAARNIALRTLLVRQDWMSTGCLSATPDVRGVYPNADASDEEAKARRLQRYLELRWSPEASSHHTTSAVGGVVDSPPKCRTLYFRTCSFKPAHVAYGRSQSTHMFAIRTLYPSPPCSRHGWQCLASLEVAVGGDWWYFPRLYKIVDNLADHLLSYPHNRNQEKVGG